MYYIHILLILLLFNCNQKSNLSDIDSIRDDKADSLYKLSYNLMYEDSSAAIQHAEELLTYSKEKHLKNYRSKAYFLIAHTNKIHANHSSAVENYYELLTSARENDHREFTYAALNNLGRNYYTFGQYEAALEFFEEALDDKITSGDSAKIADLTFRMGLCNKKLGNYHRAEVFYRSSLNWYKELKNEDQLSHINILIGNLLEKTAQHDSALFYYNNALVISDKAKNLASAYNNIGYVYESKGNDHFAKENYLKVIHLSGVPDNIKAISYNNLGEIYFKEDSLENAVQYFNSVIELMANKKFHSGLIKAHNFLYRIYHSLEDHENEYLHGIYLANNSLPLVELEDKLDAVSHLYRFERLRVEREIAKLVLQKERLITGFISLVLLFTLLGVSYRWRKYLGKWRKLKDKYNHFANQYNEFMKKYRETITAQLKLNRELGAIADTEITDPREYLWKDFDDDDEDPEDKTT